MVGLVGLLCGRAPATRRRSGRSSCCSCARPRRSAGAGQLPGPRPVAALHRAHAGAARALCAERPPAGPCAAAGVQTLAFEDVCYAYRPDRPVLSGVSFEVARGEAVGIIGPSGAGKSTLIQILLQLRSPQQGRYLVNGVPAEQFARDDWHAPGRLRAAGTASAARLGRRRTSATSARSRRRRRWSRPRGWLASTTTIVGWPDGYDTIVGPRADAVSGGQQQRHLPCARARREARGARARRAHQRARSPLGGADPGVADGAQARAHAVHHRPPHVDARHLRSRDGDHRRPAGGVRHDRAPARARTPTTARPR